MLQPVTACLTRSSTAIEGMPTQRMTPANSLRPALCHHLLFKSEELPL